MGNPTWVAGRRTSELLEASGARRVWHLCLLGTKLPRVFQDVLDVMQ